MKNGTAELRKLKRRFDKKPRIPGVNGWMNFGFMDKWEGKKDAQANQICEYGQGHITPHIDDKTRLFDSYVDTMYLKTSLYFEPVVTEANALVVEFNIINNQKDIKVADGGENAQRQEALNAANAANREKRKSHILMRIAEIKSESDMIHESLQHHLECAEGIFYSCISRYWKGVLAASSEKLGHFPNIEHKEYEGRKIYLENREKLVTMIDHTIIRGGSYEEE